MRGRDFPPHSSSECPCYKCLKVKSVNLSCVVASRLQLISIRCLCCLPLQHLETHLPLLISALILVITLTITAMVNSSCQKQEFVTFGTQKNAQNKLVQEKKAANKKTLLICSIKCWWAIRWQEWSIWPWFKQTFLSPIMNKKNVHACMHACTRACVRVLGRCSFKKPVRWKAEICLFGCWSRDHANSYVVMCFHPQTEHRSNWPWVMWPGGFQPEAGNRRNAGQGDAQC